MSRTKKISPSPAVAATTVRDRIRAAEKSLLSGAKASVLISETDLENVASLIIGTGSTQAQILKKAVHLGLQVLRMGSPVEQTVAAHEEPFETVWAKPEPVPYAGFNYELRKPAGRHEPVLEDPIVDKAETSAIEVYGLSDTPGVPPGGYGF